ERNAGLIAEPETGAAAEIGGIDPAGWAFDEPARFIQQEIEPRISEAGATEGAGMGAEVDCASGDGKGPAGRQFCTELAKVDIAGFRAEICQLAARASFIIG